MHGWIQKLFKSKVPLSSDVGKEAEVTSVPSSPSQTVSPPGAACCQRQSLLNSAVRWTRPYDVFVCHSSEHSDTEEAERLVSFLEAPPHNLRCFLSDRDSCPGAAIPSELCQAVQNSHIKVLLISHHFLRDEWCTYVMHQTLADGPMSNRMIPLVRNLLHSEFPPELKVYSYCDLNRSTQHCYLLVKRTVLQYLKDLVQKQNVIDSSIESSVT
ncbi:toll/interleukin-1 receptor domain-containing adapter protein [Eucyclogobius newberryi]|uniref:toll/interleukin-1 receptor domain-containing adapter protein n=1 Tax=Eucyclogobius newberryi TaxID=166745 RepID=UPI003B5A096B